MAETIPRSVVILALLLCPIPILYVLNYTILLSFKLDNLHILLAEIIVAALFHKYIGLPDASDSLSKVLGGSDAAAATTSNQVARIPTSSSPAPSSGAASQSGAPRKNAYPGMSESMIKEFLELADTVHPKESDPWALVASVANPWIEVYKKANTDFCFKVLVELETTPETIFDTLADIDHRRDWDEMCEDAGVVDNVDANTKVQYMKTKGVFPAASRDALVLAYVGKLKDGRYINVTKSVPHEGVPALTNGTIRMEVKIAGQVVGPSPTRPGHCRITQVADGDLKGWLPKSVVSFVATKAVPGGFVTLNKMMKALQPKQTSTTLDMAAKGQVPKISFGPGIGREYYYDGDAGSNTGASAPATGQAAANGHIAGGGGVAVKQPNSILAAIKMVRDALDSASPIMISVVLAILVWKTIRGAK
ncbi:hypothetical protein SmJEL517_g04972 [Synchytrium microbalum]|uniref:START domain-containing protein n=1 Tax=Synchytrium microbalum TaxID=1806994 RepID=A0A507BP22_9FUNG|nr:uncharacterized protein SmJEL517_g04972 [Synchytrium microbalum]TPX31770.1 hypothetical protein SmJEL517_g04972 [Synchytrium microbalum]